MMFDHEVILQRFQSNSPGQQILRVQVYAFCVTLCNANSLAQNIHTLIQTTHSVYHQH